MGHSVGDGIIVAAIAAAIVAYLYFGHVERRRRATRSSTRSAWPRWTRAFRCPSLPLDPARVPEADRSERDADSWHRVVGLRHRLHDHAALARRVSKRPGTLAVAAAACVPRRRADSVLRPCLRARSLRPRRMPNGLTSGSWSGAASGPTRPPLPNWCGATAGPVFRLVVSILGQGFSADAEDVAQDVMLRVHHALSSFRGEAKFGSSIYRVAFNQALNVKARVRYRSPHVSDQALAAMPSPNRRADDRLQDARRQEGALVVCVGELPEVYQSALRLFYSRFGASVSEIAVMLDAPENTVKSYLHRAEQLLHAQLAQRGFDAR